MNVVVQQNAGAAEEMASTAEELSSQATQLQDAIAYFKVGSENGNGRFVPARAHRIATPPDRVPRLALSH
jgi:methyl-accepting chemotaxis protein